MKNKVSDVRTHLVEMMEKLNDPECRDENVEAAKALSGLAGQYVQAVKVELDAVRVMDKVGLLPAGIEQPKMVDWSSS